MRCSGRGPQERRQYLKDLLGESLTRYREGRGDLAALVSDVESLITSLSEVADEEWGRRCQDRLVGA